MINNGIVDPYTMKAFNFVDGNRHVEVIKVKINEKK